VSTALEALGDSSGEPAWELVHDSLVPRVLAWLDRVDLTVEINQ
jgi:hypothetical protein